MACFFLFFFKVNTKEMKKGACLGSTNNLPHCHLVHTQREREREREREKHDISVGNKYRHTTRNQVSGKGKERKKERKKLLTYRP